jgi:hypothetical protein
LVSGKAAVLYPAPWDFPSDSTSLWVETAGVVELYRGFPKNENADIGRKTFWDWLMNIRTYLKIKIRGPGKA